MGYSAAAVVAAGAAIYQGEAGRSAQRKQRDIQRQAQDKQASVAAEAQRRSMRDAAGRRQPDLTSILGQERSANRTGPASTLLTGSSGLRAGGLLLGRSTLGGAG